MPRTRAREAVPTVEVEGGENNQASAPEHGVRVGRGRARAKSRAGQERRDEEEALLDTDDQEDVGKTLHVKDGRLGFVTAKGFISATNFNIDIESQVSSLHYSIKGESFGQINSIKK